MHTACSGQGAAYSAPPPISLQPLACAYHAAPLQQLYRATVGYWRLFGSDQVPAEEAERELAAAEEDPQRHLLGILLPRQPGHPQAGAELIGCLDLRLHWPTAQVATIGRLLVAEPYQRQGIGRQSWALLQPWLRGSAGMVQARARVEQFNPGALRFFTQIGFVLTGETTRVKVGAHFVRLLTMEQSWAALAAG